MPPRVRHLDPAKVAEAFARQHDAIVEWRTLLNPEQRREVPVSQFSGTGSDVTELIGLLEYVRDLHAAVPDPPPPYDPAALALVTRALVDRLAATAPGRSVEVRVPPYAAVQCIEGPRHTRGKPPSVVETDPLTWLDLATGRLNWSAAVATGRISASGERSDLSRYLPLLQS